MMKMAFKRWLHATIVYFLLIHPVTSAAAPSSGTVGMSSKGEEEELYIAGFFPFSGPLGSVGRGVHPAVELAIEHVNNDTSVLPGLRLNVTYMDTKVSVLSVSVSVFV